ncbi:Oxygen regulatory protein NreC [Pontiella desulfatans]|uniref:Oxygen regulatory protein NreC n=1 Tax=Pontiella desulfatans TaxID=2750659 RepID=A0A6C2U0T9_PONDE|nr:response regulator transcription factor [Pontiella desulfatans]VGO13006.1 Oxygen regulatory protein NreC [Pontiella desulfatans]
MLTQSDDYHHVIQALQNGAAGYVLKSSELDDIERTIMAVHQGGLVIDPSLSRVVLSSLLPGNNPSEKALLSPREIEVLSAFADGLTKKEAATKLDISYHTVDQFTRRILEKLAVPSAGAAIATAVRKGLI